MTTIELEQYLEGLNETQNLDYKTAIPWNAKSMAKDFIAMANVRDGGAIVIGVTENKGIFTRTGVDDSIAGTYKVDIMRDQLASYMDPSVDFTVHFPIDQDERKYVFIKIQPFKEVPVISRCNIPDELIRNTIYYRNTNKRVESAPVSNSNDLRDIIETSAVRMMQRRKVAGFTVALPETYWDSNRTVTSDEPPQDLTGAQSVNHSPLIRYTDLQIEVPEDGVLSTIRSLGYWEVKFIPAIDGQISTLKECLDIVERARTRLNWDFPHIPHNNNDQERLLPGDKCYQAESDMGARKEVWQFYQTEHFIMYRSLIEDWYAGDPFRGSIAEQYPPGEFLNLYSSLTLLITEVIEFLSRLCQAGLYETGVRLSMTLHNVKNRKLKIDASGRMPFIHERKTLASEINVGGDYSPQEIITNGLDIGNGYIMKILDAFGFNPPNDTFLKIQQDWLNGSFR